MRDATASAIAAEIREAGGEALDIACDVSSEAQLDALLATLRPAA